MKMHPSGVPVLFPGITTFEEVFSKVRPRVRDGRNPGFYCTVNTTFRTESWKSYMVELNADVKTGARSAIVLPLTPENFFVEAIQDPDSGDVSVWIRYQQITGYRCLAIIPNASLDWFKEQSEAKGAK